MEINKGSFHKYWSTLQRRPLSLIFDNGDIAAFELSLSVS